jgi:hypothetical protein
LGSEFLGILSQDCQENVSFCPGGGENGVEMRNKNTMKASFEYITSVHPEIKDFRVELSALSLSHWV